MTQPQPRKPRAVTVRIDAVTLIEGLAYALCAISAMLEPRVIPGLVGIWLLLLVERR